MFPPGTRILIVDDSADIELIVRFILEENGAEVFSADNAERAVALANEASPQLIFMDATLPGMSGYDATRELRKSGFSGAIVAMTARRGEEHRAKEAGCDGYLAKPVDADVLLDVASRHISRILEAG